MKRLALASLIAASLVSTIAHAAPTAPTAPMAESQPTNNPNSGFIRINPAPAPVAVRVVPALFNPSVIGSDFALQFATSPATNAVHVPAVTTANIGNAPALSIVLFRF